MDLNATSTIAMPNLRKSPVYVLIILALIGVLVGFGQAIPASIVVQAGEEEIYPINLVVEDRVLIQYRLVGGNVRALQFSISFPNATVRNFSGTGDFSYSFICDAEGEHVLHFDNTDQTEELRVTLDYEITHYILGMPQMLFMVLIIVLACIGGVVAFVMLGKTY